MSFNTCTDEGDAGDDGRTDQGSTGPDQPRGDRIGRSGVRRDRSSPRHGTVRAHVRLCPRRAGARHRSRRLRRPPHGDHRGRSGSDRRPRSGQAPCCGATTALIVVGARTSIQDGSRPAHHAVHAHDGRGGVRRRASGPPRGLHDPRRRTDRLRVGGAARGRRREWCPSLGAGAVVTNGTVVPAGAMALGIPAKIREGAASAAEDRDGDAVLRAPVQALPPGSSSDRLTRRLISRSPTTATGRPAGSGRP